MVAGTRGGIVYDRSINYLYHFHTLKKRKKTRTILGSSMLEQD